MKEDGTFERMSKTEALSLHARAATSCRRVLGGIKDMGALPDALFVIDVGYHKIAVTEAKKLGIPIVGVVDTNHNRRRHRLRDSGQRRLEPRDPPLRARRRRRGARRQAASTIQEIVSQPATSSSRCEEPTKARNGPFATVTSEGASQPLFHDIGRNECSGAGNGGNHRKHGDGAAPAHRARHDGMQEGADRSGRRHREGRGAAAHQERRQGEQGRRARRRRRRRSASPSRRTGRPARWSRSTARPTSSRRTTTSARSRTSSRSSSRASNPADVAALSARTLAAGETVEARRVGARAEDRREHHDPPLRARCDAQGELASYLHGTRIGVLVDYTGGDETLGKDLAMHVAATKPVARVARPGAGRASSTRSARSPAARAAESGKPAEIVAKMVEGAVDKFLDEVTLLRQPFVKDDKQTVEQMLEGAGRARERLHALRRRRGHREEARTTSPPKWPR